MINETKISIDAIYLECDKKYNLSSIINYMEFVIEMDISTFRFQLFHLSSEDMIKVFS